MVRSFLGKNAQGTSGVYAFLFVFVGVAVSICHAQITLDGTVGPGVAEPLMPMGNTFDITADKGTIAGNNLMHSFGEFNLTASQIANFSGPANIANIISRVTGGNVSNIDGTLQSTIAGANFFFVNPAGVIFGPNAQLNVTGSFVVSTADELRLADGKIFSAVDPTGADNVLLSAPPSAFGFLNGQPLAEVGVRVNGATLTVATGQSIAIVADDGIDGDGATVAGVVVDGGTLNAPSGKVSLASVASAGQVTYAAATHAVDLDAASFDQLGAVEMVNGALLDPSGAVGGTAVIRGGRLTIGSGSAITSNNLSGADGAPVAIDVDVTGPVVMDGATFQVVTIGGRPGDILIAAGSFEARNSAQIQTFTIPGAPGGTGLISITTDSGADFFGSSDVLNLNQGPGIGGNIEVHGFGLQVLDGSSLLTKSSGSAGTRAGDLVVDVTEMLVWGAFSGGGGLKTEVGSQTTGAGDAGDVSITTSDVLQIVNGGDVSSIGKAGSTGNTGNVTINSNSVLVFGTTQFTKITSNADGAGHGGVVDITTPSLTMQGQGAVIQARSTNSGDGGQVNLAVGTLAMSSRASINADAFGSGSAGNITIDWMEPMSSAGMITMSGGSTIFATSRSTADAGNVLINPLGEGESPTGTVALSGNAAIRTSASAGQGGNAGDLTINAQTITLDGTNVPGEFTGLDASSDNDGGHGGLITLNAADEIKLTHRASVTNGAFGPGMGGHVMVLADTLTLESGGAIGTQALAAGDGGGITIYANTVAISGAGAFEDPADVGNSNIFSQVGPNATGNSGDIIIAGPMSGVEERVPAQLVRITDGGNISTTTGGPGTGGNIEVNTAALEVFGVNATLRQNLIDAGALDATQARGGILSGSTPSFGGNGDAGDIQINGGTAVAVTDGGFIGTGTRSDGAGGDIEINTETLTIATEGFVSSESSANNGLAGQITFNVAQNIKIQSGGSVRTSSEFGSGANMALTAGVDLILNNGTISSAAAINGGNIKVNSPHFVYLVNSVITAEAGNLGGNIDIDPIAVVLNNSRLIASAAQGQGGNVRVIAQAFITSPLTLDPLALVIDVTGGIEEGSIEIISPDTDLSGSLVQLSENLLDEVAQLSETCAIKLEGEFSSFIVVGRGGVPVEPGRGLPSFHLRGGAGNPNKTVTE